MTIRYQIVMTDFGNLPLEVYYLTREQAEADISRVRTENPHLKELAVVEVDRDAPWDAVTNSND